jgi:quinolinate synthase
MNNALGLKTLESGIEEYYRLSPEILEERISEVKARLADRLLILGHNYQRDEVYKFADYTGDSLRLSQYAAQRKDREYIVFCGVKFMAETADILTRPEQKVILPDLAAGCSMADMADIDSVETAWQEITAHIPETTITPITYINSAADLKAFCGERGGFVLRPTPKRSSGGPSSGAKRSCFFPISTWGEIPASEWASRWMK